MKIILMGLVLHAGVAFSATGSLNLEKANINTSDVLSIQNGAKIFVNYCLNCHEATHMRYNRLVDLGLSLGQIKSYLMFATEKTGDPMKVAMNKEDGRKWFGVTPPDLSVITRIRGEDWLYSYMRSFYRDQSRITGWNNTVYPNVAMPHVLWELQGVQILEGAEVDMDIGMPHGSGLGQVTKLVVAKPGQLNSKDYDQVVRDLVNYLAFMAEPSRNLRVRIGILVLFVLSFLLVLTWLLKREYWRDVQ